MRRNKGPDRADTSPWQPYTKVVSHQKIISESKRSIYIDRQIEFPSL